MLCACDTPHFYVYKCQILGLCIQFCIRSSWASFRMAQWIRRPPTERKIPGSIPGVEALIFLWELLCDFLPHKQANDFDMARNLWQKAFRFCDFLGCPTSSLLVGQPNDFDMARNLRQKAFRMNTEIDLLKQNARLPHQGSNLESSAP